MAKWTLQQIADAIMNDVTDGLQGSPNTPIAYEQVKAEVILYRNALLREITQASMKCQDSKDALQQINCIEVTDGTLSECCEEIGDSLTPVARIPQVLTLKGSPAISFAGDPFRTSFGWSVYDGEGYKLRKYKVGVSARPYIVLFPPKQGYHPAFIFNAPNGITNLSVTGIFTDPFAKYDYSCCSVPGDPEELVFFPASDSVIQKILDSLTKKYIAYYRQGNAPIQNNDQTDKVT